MFPLKFSKTAAALALLLPLASQAPSSVPDIKVLDQDGHALHFYQDLVQNRVVAINFIFTTCQTICTLLGATFAKTDRLLADRHVSNVLLISISIDPANDGPAQLRNFAARYGITHHWKLVTGEKQDVEQLLRSLGEYTPDKTAHTGRVLIGRGDGSWTRVDGLGSAQQIADLLSAAAAAQHGKSL
ncbi:MAG TPA: SCO family protein [Candidatus Angelobacter sp.]|nr:SCO family protein [Candidatus Angelobacter sp.]